MASSPYDLSCLRDVYDKNNNNNTHLDGEDRAGCLAQFINLVSRDCCVALPRGAMSLSAVVIVIFPDHTHLLV